MRRTSYHFTASGHYACTCYHPLFVFNQFGDLECCALRPGNVHSADEWDAVLKPVVARYQGKAGVSAVGLDNPPSTRFGGADLQTAYIGLTW